MNSNSSSTRVDEMDQELFQNVKAFLEKVKVKIGEWRNLGEGWLAVRVFLLGLLFLFVSPFLRPSIMQRHPLFMFILSSVPYLCILLGIILCIRTGTFQHFLEKWDKTKESGFIGIEFFLFGSFLWVLSTMYDISRWLSVIFLIMGAAVLLHKRIDELKKKESIKELKESGVFDLVFNVAIISVLVATAINGYMMYTSVYAPRLVPTEFKPPDSILNGTDIRLYFTNYGQSVGSYELIYKGGGLLLEAPRDYYDHNPDNDTVHFKYAIGPGDSSDPKVSIFIKEDPPDFVTLEIRLIEKDHLVYYKKYDYKWSEDRERYVLDK